jgi:GNAT superfamily N-acetyltransferase
VAAAAALLTDGFADSMGYPPQARSLLARHIESYLARHAALLPAAAVLGATLVPAADPRAADLTALAAEDSFSLSSADPALRSGGGGLVASAELSFDPSTRGRALGGLDPPKDDTQSAYLCNMAVTAPARGRGVGRALLAAAHAAAAAGGAERVYLHLRLKDASGPAGRLYGSAGYVEVGRDAPLVRVLGRDRRCLLVKELGER